MRSRKSNEGEIAKALRTGRCSRHGRSITKLEFVGECRIIMTVDGPRHVVTGVLSGYHHTAHVLQVDFDRDRVTDFGYSNFSVTTNRRLDDWMGELQRMRLPDMLSLTRGWIPFAYTSIGRDSPYARPNNHTRDKIAGGLWRRFCQGAPWVVRENYYLWFDGRSYNPAIVRDYHAMKNEILEDNNWRYLTADWIDGAWTKRFIDDTARENFERREARRQ